MTDEAATTRTIEVDEDVHDVLQRTAATRETDANEVLRYLLEVPEVPAAVDTDEDDE
jgi:hypothetical protein